MINKTDTTQIKLIKPQKTHTQTIKAECKTEISTEQTAKILSVNAFPVLTKDSLGADCVSFSGVVNFYICYQDSQGEIKKYECSTDFSGDIKCEVLPDCKLFTDIVLEKTDADASGVRLSVSATLTAKAILTQTQAIDCLVNGEELIVNPVEVQTVKSLGVRESLYPIQEEFELDFAVDCVLSQRLDARITAVQCGVGTVIIDGEAEITAIFLQKGEKNDIIRENRSVPFRVEVECEEAMPSNFAVATVRERSIKTDFAVDLEKNKSVMNASINLRFIAEAFGFTTTTLADDLFCTTKLISCENKRAECIEPLECRFATCLAQTPISLQDLDGAKILALGNERCELTEVKALATGVSILGAVYFTIYAQTENGELITRKLECPISCQAECVLPSDCDFTFEVRCVRAKAKPIDSQTADAEFTLYLTFFPKQKCFFDYVEQVTVLGEKPTQTQAISVYIPLNGESLWSLSKRLNTPPERLIATNKDLQFPLTGKERIVIYRQL